MVPKRGVRGYHTASSFFSVKDEWEDILVCLECGHSVELERYGMEDDEEYEALYPTREEVCGEFDED